jgi:deoxyadenosine/deoxycytidine kinase
VRHNKGEFRGAMRAGTGPAGGRVDAPPSYIVVEGPIGVGKTSLARRLSESFGSDLLLEEVEHNPFLERFYKDRRSGALPAQLFFLFQRARQMEALRQDDLFNPVRVADFLLARDRLFAELNLDAEEFALYEQIYARTRVDAPPPDLVVYLQAPVDVLLDRISRRGGAFDHFLDRAYLERLADAYTAFFYDYDESPLLIVNAASIDPVNNDQDYRALFEQICRTHGGRHFFNPVTAIA